MIKMSKKLFQMISWWSILMRLSLFFYWRQFKTIKFENVILYTIVISCTEKITFWTLFIINSWHFHHIKNRSFHPSRAFSASFSNMSIYSVSSQLSYLSQTLNWVQQNIWYFLVFRWIVLEFINSEWIIWLHQKQAIKPERLYCMIQINVVFKWKNV